MNLSPTDDIWGAVSMLLVMVGLVAMHLITTHHQTNQFKAHVDELAATVEKIRNQVQNSHDTNLRDDIDKIAVKVDNVDRLSRRIGAEIRTDREEFREFRKDTYSKIRHYDTVVAKHHPEDED